MKISYVIPAAAIVSLSACAFAPPGAGQDKVIHVNFACANGERLDMRFFRDKGRALLVRDGKALELRQQVSGSGFIYGDGSTTVRGKGEELTVEAAGAAPLQCVAR